MMVGHSKLPNWLVPGQQVVCVYAGRWAEVSNHPNPPMVWPHKHFIYTISEVAQTERSAYIALVEHGPCFEYDYRGFEPVDEREVEAELFAARCSRQTAGAQS